MNRSHIKTNYRVRYIKTMENLAKISNMQPQETYMHCLMDTVIFQDFETALDVVMENFRHGHNDNSKEGQAHD